ncbi:hypothetical protein EVA_13576 [gut metagenome]|uniref:Uncharacterized protein n=1 Tax=gut metagenome TaxID=749906 RepID=J9G969_9ZZZZ
MANLKRYATAMKSCRNSSRLSLICLQRLRKNTRC